MLLLALAEMHIYIVQSHIPMYTHTHIYIFACTHTKIPKLFPNFNWSVQFQVISPFSFVNVIKPGEAKKSLDLKFDCTKTQYLGKKNSLFRMTPLKDLSISNCKKTKSD